MTVLDEKFRMLGTEHAPGQEVRQGSRPPSDRMTDAGLSGTSVDFSHGDVDAFPPCPGTLEAFTSGISDGGRQAYTEYRGKLDIREAVSSKLADFTGAAIDPDRELIITPGTQGALFLAMGATVGPGDKVAIVDPDYFANRKLVAFFGGEVVAIRMTYEGTQEGSGLDLTGLEEAFRRGVRLFVFSNPNNPSGAVYAKEEIKAIASLSTRYGATVIVDQLYSRLIYSDARFSHLRAEDISSDAIVTIMGPSKFESLSGYRLGVAFGSRHIIERMEKLQAIVSLRAAGYAQAVLTTWFEEPQGWVIDRVRAHERIRDDLRSVFEQGGLSVRVPDGGSYLFPQLPDLNIGLIEFVSDLRRHAGIIVTPGTEFGPFPMSFRINFSQDHSAAVDAAKRIVTLVADHRR